jgi:hypothetical protein
MQRFRTSSASIHAKMALASEILVLCQTFVGRAWLNDGLQTPVAGLGRRSIERAPLDALIASSIGIMGRVFGSHGLFGFQNRSLRFTKLDQPFDLKYFY